MGQPPEMQKALLVRPSPRTGRVPKLRRDYGRLRRRPRKAWLQVPPSHDVVSPNCVSSRSSAPLSVLKSSRSVLCRELGHKTTQASRSPVPADTTYHITVLASTDMTVGRFRAFAAHIYVSGDIPRAKYSSFSSTYTVIRRGSREKKVVDVSKALPLVASYRVPPRAC